MAPRRAPAPRPPSRPPARVSALAWAPSPRCAAPPAAQPRPAAVPARPRSSPTAPAPHMTPAPVSARGRLNEDRGLIQAFGRRGLPRASDLTKRDCCPARLFLGLGGRRLALDGGGRLLVG